MKAYKISDSNVDGLKEHGATVNQAIGNLLGNPQGNLNDKEGNPKVTQLGNPSLKAYIDESLAELKERFNIVLKNLNKKIESQGDSLQEDFNKRVNSFLNNAFNSRVETLREHLLKECREEIKKSLKV